MDNLNFLTTNKLNSVLIRFRIYFTRMVLGICISPGDKFRRFPLYEPISYAIGQVKMIYKLTDSKVGRCIESQAEADKLAGFNKSCYMAF